MTALLPVLACLAVEAGGAGGAEILQRSDDAFYYAGPDFKARVTMELVAASGAKRSRTMTMLRRNLPRRDQQYFIFFHEPGEVRGMSFLVWKHPERDDDRWMFVPAIKAIRRVAASDSQASFFGSDFTYEDLSGRDLTADTHTLLREEPIEGAPCWLIESRPRAPSAARRLSWIDKVTLLPRRREHYQGSQLLRVFTAQSIEAVSAARPTVTRMTMANVENGHRTVVILTGVSYDVHLTDDVFTERSLQTPPARWLH